ncbi:MAG: NOG1 family protein [Halobacteriaceae archaeon]
MIFEDLPTTPTADELLDKAFSRAERAGRAKSGIEAQESMLLTASNILSDNLENIVNQWPDLNTIHPFYRNLANAIADVDAIQQNLAEISWAATKTKELGREYQNRLSSDVETARKMRKQGFARMASVVEEISDELEAINDARNQLNSLPDIQPDEPTIVVAGYPNVGKSSFVNTVTRTSIETASYPFTTKQVHVGHFKQDHIRYQIIDTPGLLDRPDAERNDIESQAVTSLTHIADCIIFILDASETCGYTLSSQRSLLAEIESKFTSIPILTVCNKADLSTDVDTDYYMSIKEDENVTDVLEEAINAIDYEPELPYNTD